MAGTLQRLANEVHWAIYGSDSRNNPSQVVLDVLTILEREKLRITNSYRKQLGLEPKEYSPPTLPNTGIYVRPMPKKKFNVLDKTLNKVVADKLADSQSGNFTPKDVSTHKKGYKR